ncbi:MAG: class I SAM-dependent methyltransferase [Actinomycetota bacterium]
MDRAVIKEHIESFPTWHYQFDLGGQLTLINREFRINGHEQRKRYFFEPLIEVCGGDLRGKRVLDLGCNAGFWSLEAIERGADFVLGIDGRRMNVDQANFVFEAKGIDRKRYEFATSNLFEFDYEPYGNFEIVLCLGLMNHVSEPVALMDLVSRVNDDICVIDTMLSISPGSYLRLRTEDSDGPLNTIERELVASPTKRAVIDMARAFGYEIVTLEPHFSDWTGARKYLQGRRKAFIAAKRTPLEMGAYPTESDRALPRPSEYLRLVRDVAVNRVRKLVGRWHLPAS